MVELALLPARGVIEVSGEDRVGFLQGLVSNDIALAVPGRAVWTALLTPQGRWLADFFVFADGERLLLDVEREQVAQLVQRLGRFRLRAKVALRDLSGNLAVYAAWDGVLALPAGAVAAPDPRVEGAGWRLLSPTPLAATADAEAWDRHRLSLGLPDGTVDLEAEKTLLLEAGFDELNGVSWSKGCYMGQELTARTKYRGLVKRRLVPVDIDGAAPPPGTLVLRDGVEVGALRSARDGRGLATLRLEAIGAGALRCGGATLRPDVPAWMRLPESAS
jgi:folate-binding protein YgfZ